MKTRIKRVRFRHKKSGSELLVYGLLSNGQSALVGSYRAEKPIGTKALVKLGQAAGILPEPDNIDSIST